MVDIDKLEREFTCLRDRLRDICGHVIRNENVEAAFLIGRLHSICHSHVLELQLLMPPQIVQPKTDNEGSAP